MTCQCLFTQEPIGEPAWRSSLFTDAEREAIFNGKMGEISDSIKDLATEELDEVKTEGNLLELVELLAYIEQDVSSVCSCLVALKGGYCSLEDLKFGEFEAHRIAASFIERFTLYDYSRLTDLGKAYMEVYR